MLEVVGVHGAVFDDGVGHDVVVVGLDIEGDVLLGKDRLGNLEDLSVRSRRSGNRDGLTGESVIVNGSIVTVGRIVDGADDSAVILFIDVIDDLLALKRGDERLDLIGALVAFLHGQNVGISRGGTLDHKGVGHRVQTCVDGVVGVDDGVVNVLQNIGDLCGLGLYDLDAIRIFDNVVLGGSDAGAVGELDDAVFLEQEQGTRFIGGVVGNSDLNGSGAVAIFGAAAGQGERGGKNECKSQCGQLDRMLFHRIDLLLLMVF